MLLSLFSISTNVFAERQEPNEQADFFEMSIEDLMEVPVVVSASRQAQKIGELSIPVSVVTSEDIHYSGLTSIGEVLQFTPGVDMLKLNRYWDVVGIRGVHDRFSDRIQTLINGRLADSGIFGGPMFFTFPVMLEDIDRIEIVRGPSSAAWGANAFTGVINIITKKPEDILGTFGSTTITQFGDTYTHLRYAEKKDNWQWRASAGYEDMKSSDDALDGGSASYEIFDPAASGVIGYDSYTARDFARISRFDLEAIYGGFADTKISLGVGYSRGIMGDFEFAGFFPKRNNYFRRLRPFIRIDHQYENADSAFLEWAGNFDTINLNNIALLKTSENSLTGQYNFAPVDGHHRSIGANFRWNRIYMSRDYDQGWDDDDTPSDEYWAGLFAVDRWDVTDRLTLEGQIRGDYYSEVQSDWAGRLSALYALDGNKEHMLRFSIARAFRTPLVQPREVSGHAAPMGGPYYLVNAYEPENLDNEQVVSFEAGYTGKIAPGATLRVNTYYQHYSEMLGYNTTIGALGEGYYTCDNIGGGNAWGSEIELAMQNKKGKLSVWYAYNDFQEDSGGQDIRALAPARHKAGLTGRVFLPDGWTFNSNYKFTDTTVNYTGPFERAKMAGFHRFDLTISKKIAGGNSELMFGVSDLLNKTSKYRYFGMGNMTAHEVVGRTFFVRLQLKF